MKQFIASMALVATCSLGVAISPSVAAPFGSPPKQPVGKATVTPVSFVLDPNQQVLITAGDGWYYQVQDDGQGGYVAVDVNGVPWTFVLCCTAGQIDNGQGQQVIVVSAVLWESTGHYGAPLVYDGGINVAYPWAPQQ